MIVWRTLGRRGLLVLVTLSALLSGASVAAAHAVDLDHPAAELVCVNCVGSQADRLIPSTPPVVTGSQGAHEAPRSLAEVAIEMRADLRPRARAPPTDL